MKRANAGIERGIFAGVGNVIRELIVNVGAKVHGTLSQESMGVKRSFNNHNLNFVLERRYCTWDYLKQNTNKYIYAE